MSTRELFGDSSSSEDDEGDNDDVKMNENNEPKPTTTAATAATAAVVDQTEASATGEGQEETKQQTTNDDDDDDDDALFDGKAVQGVSSTTLAGTVKGPAPMDVDRDEEGKQADSDDDDDDDENNKNKDNNNDKPQLDPRTLIVPEFHNGPTQATQVFMTKLPNLLGIQSRAFDSDQYFPEQEEEEFGPQSAFNLVRWRYAAKQNNNNNSSSSSSFLQERESNTRLVQWDDGSWTLHVGKEAFEVELNDSSDKQTGFAGHNGYLYLSQKATLRPNCEDDNNNNNNNDAIATTATASTTATALECLGPVHSRLTIRPSSLQSEAHKSLTLAVRQKTIKRARIAEFTTTEDPEKLKQERIRVKQDLEKAAMLRKSGGYPRARVSGSGGGGAAGAAGRRPRMSRSYLEEEEEDDRAFDTTDIRAMKKRMFDRDMDDYGDEFDDDEDESEDETFHRVRPKQKGAAGKASKKDVDKEDSDDEEEEVFGGDEEEDDDEKVAPVVKTNKKRPAQSMFDDDDDDSD